MATEYVPIRITSASRAALDRLVFQLTGAAERRVTLSDAITAACTVASAHLAEAAEAVAPAPKSGESGTPEE